MNLYSQFTKKNKKLALLIDPDKTSANEAALLSKEAEENGFNFIFVGGSLVTEPIDELVEKIKLSCNIPVVLFPGSPFQLTPKADGLLLLSLISGRNPEYLIGHHVNAAPVIKKYKLITIPTGYILINGGKVSSTEYMSNTKAIPSSKIDIIKSTALAGELLGLKLIYLEAGSGANNSVSEEIIKEVKKTVSIPVIVGGGIYNIKQLNSIYNAGADVVVIGTAIEKDKSLIKKLAKALKTL